MHAVVPFLTTTALANTAQSFFQAVGDQDQAWIRAFAANAQGDVAFVGEGYPDDGPYRYVSVMGGNTSDFKWGWQFNGTGGHMDAGSSASLVYTDGGDWIVTGTCRQVIGKQDKDVWVARGNATHVAWSWAYGGSGKNVDEGRAVYLDTSGDVMVLASTNSFGWGTSLLPFKLDAATGELKQAWLIGTEGMDVGLFGEELSPGIWSFGGYSDFGRATKDVLSLSFNTTTDTVINAQLMGTEYYDVAHAMAVSPDGKTFATVGQSDKHSGALLVVHNATHVRNATVLSGYQDGSAHTLVWVSNDTFVFGGFVMDESGAYKGLLSQWYVDDGLDWSYALTGSAIYGVAKMDKRLVAVGRTQYGVGDQSGLYALLNQDGQINGCTAVQPINLTAVPLNLTGDFVRPLNLSSRALNRDELERRDAKLLVQPVIFNQSVVCEEMPTTQPPAVTTIASDNDRGVVLSNGASRSQVPFWGVWTALKSAVCFAVDTVVGVGVQEAVSVGSVKPVDKVAHCQISRWDDGNQLCSAQQFSN